MNCPRYSPISLVLFAIALFSPLLLADAAFAVADGTVGNFRCTNGVASGQLYQSGANCPTTLGIGNFFSFVLCNIEQLSSNIMGHLFCGMISSLAPLVWQSVTLAVIFFGIGFTFGIVPLKGSEAVMFLIKLAFITAFATQADLLIGVGYKFLLAAMRDGVTIALQLISNPDGTTTTGNDIYTLMDGLIAKAFHFATDAVSVDNFADKCKNALFAAMVTIGIAFPVLSYLMLVVIGRLAVTFFRAVFGYAYAMLGIVFLLTLAPFFFSFFLFRQTRQMFDKWLGYLVSFALQIVLLFSFLGFVMTIEINKWVDDVSEIIMYNSETTQTSAFRFPWQYCTFCDFKVVDKNGTTLTEKDPNYTTEGKLVCKSPKTPIKPTFAIAPDTKNGDPATSSISTLLSFASTGLLSLLVLAFLVDRILTHLPYLAQKLAGGMGGTWAMQLGGGKAFGAAAMRMLGDAQIDDFSLGYSEQMKRPARDGLTGAAAAFREGASQMLRGTRSDGTYTTGPTGNEIRDNTGITGRFKNWLADPTHFEGDHEL